MKDKFQWIIIFIFCAILSIFAIKYGPRIQYKLFIESYVKETVNEVLNNNNN